MTGNDLVEREAAAREALCRLRDCGRMVERVTAAVRAAPRDPDLEQVGHRVRACTADLARVRLELRTWDIGSSLWIERVHARVEYLAEEVGLLAQVALTDDYTERRPNGLQSAAQPDAIDQVERTVRDYLYPRPRTVPVVG